MNPGDAPFQTKLCSGQLNHFNDMRKEIDDPRQDIYGDYFNLCQEKFVSAFPTPPLQTIQDPLFYRVLEEAMRDEDPDIFYENCPAMTKLVFSCIRLLPGRIADQARLTIMKLPKYSKQ